MFTGQDIKDVRKRLLEDLQRTHAHMDQMMMRALAHGAGRDGLAEGRDDCYIAGQTNLMEFGELASMERLKSVVRRLHPEARDPAHPGSLHRRRRVQIFIGEESGYALLDDCSLVTTPYRVEDRVVGVLGVIGPTRMDYQRVIPIVDVTARLLAAALRQ
jgi:heat-inducible transcriptional repressor